VAAVAADRSAYSPVVVVPVGPKNSGCDATVAAWCTNGVPIAPVPLAICVNAPPENARSSGIVPSDLIGALVPSGVTTAAPFCGHGRAVVK